MHLDHIGTLEEFELKCRLTWRVCVLNDEASTAGLAESLAVNRPFPWIFYVPPAGDNTVGANWIRDGRAAHLWHIWQECHVPLSTDVQCRVVQPVEVEYESN